MAKDYGPETSEEGGAERESVPLTGEEAELLRKKLTKFSPWYVIAVQGVVALALVFGIWLVSGRSAWVLSSGYGALAVLIPATLFARGLTRRQRAVVPGAALAGLFIWEFVKIILTVVLLLVAPRIVTDLNWLALLAGFVVSMKASWLAMLWQHSRKASITLF